jgi:hypothetical protein
MHKLAIATLVALALAAFAAIPALAASGPPVTMTTHQHDTWSEWDTNAVTGNDIWVTWDGNEVTHETYFPPTYSDPATYSESFGITVTGTISFVDNKVAYTGRATFHSTYKFNRGNESGTSTLTVHAIGSDGTSVSGHETVHLTCNGNGVVTVSFDKMSFD